MYGKILIKAKLKVLTGMHIGGSDAFSAIGAVDSPVIKDQVTQLPIIPGSSLKGKLRTLLARSFENNIVLPRWNEDKPEIKRLFGTSGGNGEKPAKSRLQFADAFLCNAGYLKETGGITEVKFENNINRMTSVADPRQIERVPRGAEFELTIVYDIEKEEEIKKDFDNLALAIKLLHLDYIGGHGTRGYGKVKISCFTVSVIEGQLDKNKAEELAMILKGVESYEILSVPV